MASKSEGKSEVEFSSKEDGLPALDPEVQQKLGEMFKSFCDELIRQPVPEKFVELLTRLEAKERRQK